MTQNKKTKPLLYKTRISIAALICILFYICLYPVALVILLLNKVFKRPRVLTFIEDHILAFLFFGVCLSFSVKVKQKNSHSYQSIPKDRAVLFMSNHASMFDIPILYRALPANSRMIAMKDVFQYPIPGFKFIMLKLGFISVDAEDKQSLKKSYQRCQHALTIRRSPLWAAPEGGLSPNDQLQPFKNGVFKIAEQANAIIIPMALIGSNRVMPKADWAELRPQFNQTVTIIYGQAIDTRDFEKNRQGLKNAVYNQIDEMMRSMNQE